MSPTSVTNIDVTSLSLIDRQWPKARNFRKNTCYSWFLDMKNNFYKICVKSRVSLEKDGNGWSRLILNDLLPNWLKICQTRTFTVMVPFLTYLTATIFMTNVNAKLMATEADFRFVHFQKYLSLFIVLRVRPKPFYFWNQCRKRSDPTKNDSEFESAIDF